jgi:hypothetical protein
MMLTMRGPVVDSLVHPAMSAAGTASAANDRERIRPRYIPVLREEAVTAGGWTAPSGLPALLRFRLRLGNTMFLQDLSDC